MAHTYGAEVAVFSPNTHILASLSELDIEARRTITPARSEALNVDQHTAVTFLFHDHDWETALLAQALETDAFFIGAMGSQATHARRCLSLEQIGISATAIARVVGPLGLIAAARDPETLALSALAQIVERHRGACSP